MKIHQITLNRLRNDANFQFHAELKARNTAFADYSIAERVNALAVVEGADYEPFIKKMNINISKFSLLMPVRKKQGKRGGGKKPTNGGSHEN